MRLLAERGNSRLLVEVRPGVARVLDPATGCFIGQAMRPGAFLKFGYWHEPSPEATERARETLERWEGVLGRCETENASDGRSVGSEEPDR